MRGTTKHSRQEIEDTLDRLRATLSVGGGQTGASARGQTVRANLAPTLDLLAEVLRQPSFPATELETLKRAQRRRTRGGALRSALDRACARSTRYDNPYPRRRRSLYADARRGDRRAAGARTSLRCKRFHQRVLRRHRRPRSASSAISIAAAVKAQLERLFGDWTRAIALCARAASRWSPSARPRCRSRLRTRPTPS